MPRLVAVSSYLSSLQISNQVCICLIKHHVYSVWIVNERDSVCVGGGEGTFNLSIHKLLCYQTSEKRHTVLLV